MVAVISILEPTILSCTWPYLSWIEPFAVVTFTTVKGSGFGPVNPPAGDGNAVVPVQYMFNYDWPAKGTVANPLLLRDAAIFFPTIENL